MRVAAGSLWDVYLAPMSCSEHNIWRIMSLIKAKSGVLAFAIGLGLAFGVLADAKAQAKPLVSDIRAAENGERTRFVLSLDRRIAFTVFPLADPYRVVIDLPEVGWQLPSRPLPAGVGLMERLRYGLFQPGTTRVVLDMKGPVAVEGVSLTVGQALSGSTFSVHLIPETRRQTTLGMLKRGDRVNLEVDYLAKLVWQFTRR